MTRGETRVGKLLVEDALWSQVAALLPPAKPRRFRNARRKPLTDRAALTGILFILKTDLPWSELPCEMNCGSGTACWMRLQEWHRLGLWTVLQPVLQAGLPYARKVNWSRALTEAAAHHPIPRGEDTADKALLAARASAVKRFSRTSNPKRRGCV